MTGQQTNQAAFSESLQNAMQSVEDTMFNVVNSDVTVLRDASRHILEAGGKRIRPRLLLSSYAVGGGTDLTKAAPLGAAIELVHTASVVHDDINDHGIVRRGRPSVNAIWGRTFALLTGDYLFTKVYELMAPYKNLNVILAEATVALVEGETLQASAVKENNFTREIYYQIIARKTAALFGAASRIGARFAGAADEWTEALGQYGYNIGLAFQIVDDLLDLTSDTEHLGKTAGIDLEQGRGFAVAHNGNGVKNGSAAIAAVDAGDPMASIKAKVLTGNAVNEAREQAQQLVAIAIHSLKVLPDSEARTELINVANLVVNRDH
jgi:octaprenyl-diphosphate synthase